MLFDSHCHLPLVPGIEDLSVIKRAISKGITAILDISVGLSDFIRRLEIKERIETETEMKVFISVGIPPYFADRWLPLDIDLLSNQIKSSGAVAIGEIGLDYHHMYGAKESQRNLFEIQLELARKHSLPVVIHNRDSEEDLIGILGEFSSSITGIIHCFSSDVTVLRRLLDLGFYISFAGNITYKRNDKLREALLYVPDDRLLIETDSPYLSPEGFRGKPNEPSRLWDIAIFVAELKKISLEELALITTGNAIRVLGIK